MINLIFQEIISGLKATPPSISPKYFYDALGSKLFELITLLEEYYPTRTEQKIMADFHQEIAAAVGTCEVFLDLGAGNCAKASRLFDSIHPHEYIALDISKEFLESAIEDLQKRFSSIKMHFRMMDLTEPFSFPDLKGKRKTFFYPGSSIGNFDEDQVMQFLINIVDVCEGNGGLLIGVDLIKDLNILEDAYNDRLGITAAFNLNALLHINRLIQGNFNLQDWEHDAFFNTSLSRIEMHLRALKDVSVSYSGGELLFKKGDRIHTESSYKYTKDHFSKLLLRAGFKSIQSWTDKDAHFLVCYASFD